MGFGALPEGWDVVLHPVAYGVGVFITALNLFPSGNLMAGVLLSAAEAFAFCC